MSYDTRPIQRLLDQCRCYIHDAGAGGFIVSAVGANLIENEGFGLWPDRCPPSRVNGPHRRVDAQGVFA